MFLKRCFAQYFAALPLICFSSVPTLAQENLQASLNPILLLEQSALACEPFGVGHVSITLGEYDSELPPRVRLIERSGRVYYPAANLRTLPPPARIEPAPARRPIGRGGLIERFRNAAETARYRASEPKALDIDFLFVGSEPLRLQVVDPRGVVDVDLPVVDALPASDQVQSASARWWSAYLQAAKRDADVGDFPSVLQTFVAETMARRLSLPIQDTQETPWLDANDPLVKPLSTMELLANTEKLREQVFRDTLRRPAKIEGAANVDVPQPPTWINAPVPEVPANLPIESIASVVPAECYYIRFGRFANYLWFREFSMGKGTGLAQMLTVRGLNSNGNAKIEKMLNTKMNMLTKLFGDSIINDMAIIGHDLYLQDGASLGVVLEARNIQQLQSRMDAERSAAAEAKKDEGVRLDQMTIMGRDVTLLSNRDHSVRSFRVVDGDYLLLTTSQTLVERFLSVRDGEPSIAATPNFRYARLLLPLQNNYELFGYFSPQFFQNLMSPKYNIELRRRYAAKSRIIAAELATKMAEAEGVPHKDLESLMDADLLPDWIGASADGSQLVRDQNRWLDSRRGGLGCMMPISDVPLLDCTPQEAELYQQDAEFYAREWRSTDPIMFGIRRFASPMGANVDKLTIEAYVSPLDLTKLGKWARFLAPPVITMIAQPPDDVVSIQAHLAGQNLLGSRAPDSVMFLGLKNDVPPVPAKDAGLIQIWRYLRATPFYLGAWPSPHYLDQLPLGLGGSSPAADGFSRALLGMWRWQGGGFSVLSFDRSILDHAIAYLQPIPATDPAQVRLSVGDIGRSDLSYWVNTMWYRRAYSACRGNLRFLDTMQDTFKLDPEEAMDTATYVLDSTIVSSLEGDYQVDDPSPNGYMQWKHESLATIGPLDEMGVLTDELQAPLTYRADWLGWLRGFQVHLTQAPEGLILLATVELEKLEVKQNEMEAVELPSLDFDLFNLPSQWFGKKDATEKKPAKEQRSF